MVEVGSADREGLGFGSDSEREFEMAFAIHVFHEEEFKILGNDEVLVAVVVEIDKDCGGTEVHPVSFAFCREVSEGAVGILEEKEIGKAPLLAEVEVFEAISIDVAECEAVVGGGVEAEVAGEAESPVVGGAKKLGLIRRILSESGGGDVGEEAGAFLFDFLVVENLKGFQERRVGVGPSAAPLGVNLEEGGFKGDKGVASVGRDVGNFDLGAQFGRPLVGDFFEGEFFRRRRTALDSEAGVFEFGDELGGSDFVT